MASFVVSMGGLRSGVRLRGVERLPARERDLERRRAAGAAFELERPADHVYALADADETEAATLCGLGERAFDLEAHPVVDDVELDRTAPCSHPHGDRRRTRMLTNVRERLLDGAEDGDALGRGQRIRIATASTVTPDPRFG